MSTLDQHIQSLQQKMQLLVKKHQQLAKENIRLKEELKQFIKFFFNTLPYQDEIINALSETIPQFNLKDNINQVWSW